jgi:hypothetical protein
MALTRIPDNLIPWRRTPAGQDVSAPRAPRDSAPPEVGADSGATHGVEPGLHHGVLDGGQVGNEVGNQVGCQVGIDDGDDLGFRIVRHDGAWVDVAVGEPEPIGADAHAEMFLVWLQGTDLAGEWLARSLLERLYGSLFTTEVLQRVGWTPETWGTVARHLRSMPGVKARLRDGRRGPGRQGKARTDYWVPKAHRRG